MSRLIQRLTALQEEELCRLYQDELWTRGRTREEVREMLEHTDLLFAFVDGEERLQAFARVLTDRVFKALVLDVIVAPEARGTGLGRRLMDAVLSCPELARVRDFELYCASDMVPFYEQWSFAGDLGGLRFLRRSRR